jgi:uncharacterized GH25 family protein
VKPVTLALAGLVLLWGLPCAAHDYWLAPEQFLALPGSKIATHLYFGDRFEIEDERPFQKPRTPFFQLVGAGGTTDLTPTPDGRKPVAELTLPTEGTYVLVLDRTAQSITLEAAQFDAYHKEEGLADVLEWRRRNRQSGAAGRERYSRSVKALLQAGQRTDPIATRPLGRRIEIVPLQNPYDLKPGQELAVQVLFEGRPLADCQVEAFYRQAGKPVALTRRTDGEGKASFRLEQPGPWIVRLVHMRPCREECAAIDWESFWSSLTFALR